MQETTGFASGRPCRTISTYWWVGGLVLSAAFCTAVMTPLLHMRVYEPLAAVVLALLVAVLAVRALGQTDLNPVSGVGKLSQVMSSRYTKFQASGNWAFRQTSLKLIDEMKKLCVVS